MTLYPTCPLCYGDLEVSKKPIESKSLRELAGYECSNVECEYFGQFTLPEDVQWVANEQCHCPAGSCVC